jgi:hypothetical protein
MPARWRLRIANVSRSTREGVTPRAEAWVLPGGVPCEPFVESMMSLDSGHPERAGGPLVVTLSDHICAAARGTLPVWAGCRTRCRQRATRDVANDYSGFKLDSKVTRCRFSRRPCLSACAQHSELCARATATSFLSRCEEACASHRHDAVDHPQGGRPRKRRDDGVNDSAKAIQRTGQLGGGRRKSASA